MIMLLMMLKIMIIISLILMMLNYFFTLNKINDREKISPFECGFEPFSSPRLPFSNQFFMISLIFLIFDIEIILFIPFMHNLLIDYMTKNFEIMFNFIFILLMGLYIEWQEGALKWLK